ncbi:NADH-quinone oxidoreductase subunit NuoE [Mycobacterium sp. ITM-2016-00317]|uniref:NADH-quinone oxidoreductase subunit NuoE n=1 Tax=Mycobacterium sp. ITM-2016-00317 TaxID=2099694 RepID=UPI00287FD5C6|nr:NADH-quinone oxidoreductase subunit NuoE [Mycobacterium sp. ITM-2016-00317]WNG89193.1 NADH-quinone oxidoreductase subunit NuoE [Mycobacterium sp. ITM-2016-00317]
MSVFLELGQRPDEPGPPIHGAAAYPAEVTARLATDAATIIARYPQARSALLPLLHLVQAEDSCLTPAGIRFCAGQLGLTDAEVTAVATFYSMYRRQPTGEYLVGVCTNTLCAVMGGDAILESLQSHLDITPGQTTDDGRVTLEHLECNAACDYAPVVMVNWDFFDNQTPSSARALVDALRAGESPAPSRGGSLCTFRDTSRILAGLDGPCDTGTPGVVGPATLAGLRFARDHDMTAPEAGTPTDSTGHEPAGPSGRDQAEAAETVKDEPAPAPSADVPAQGGTPETDPRATDS